jgi:hypothetical protein
MTGRSTRIARIIGACIAVSTLAGAIYFARGAARDFQLARRDDTSSLFRLPVELSRPAVHQAWFRFAPESRDATWMRFEVRTDANGEARQSTLRSLDQVAGSFRLMDESGETVMEANFSPADPLVGRGGEGEPPTRALRMLPPNKPYTFSIRIDQPSTQPARVELVGRVTEHEFARLIGLIAGAVAIVFLLAFLLSGVLTARSVLRQWRANRPPEMLR